MRITVESKVERTPRVAQVEGLFDLKAEATSKCEWTVALPIAERPWHVGLIVGPSGCGKSTIARHLWPEECQKAGDFGWRQHESILDAFPESMSVKDVVALLSSVGFSSPPAWLRPYHVLSTGQQFRVALARTLAELPALAVVDEFTSVVDRTVAQIGSAALAKTVRARGQKFIAVTCHEDVEAWLQPDWTYRPAEDLFQWRLLQPRPQIELSIIRCQTSAWELFRRHHYLSHTISNGAVCFLATWKENPVAFSAWLHHMSGRKGARVKREHRTVVLPDYQGTGIGMAVSSFCASLWKSMGYRATSTTTHPAFMGSRNRSPHWRMIRTPGFSGAAKESNPTVKHAFTRLTAGFEYVGPAMEPSLAHRMLAEWK